jgi:hemerythrin-like metal-binding protein
LHDAIVGGRADAEVNRTVTSLSNYIATHLGDEEKLLRENSYPELNYHIGCHEKLIEQVDRYRSRKGDCQVNAFELLRLIRKWLTDHILDEDRKYGRYLSQSSRDAVRS